MTCYDRRVARITFAHFAQIIDAAPGTRLMEVVDRHHVPIPFHCRRGQCTTCRIHVVAGTLAAALEVERGTLAQHELPPDVRLTCQALVGDQDVTIAP